MLKLRSRKAFTLLELVVALVVLGILAALAIPTYITVINNAKVAVATSTAVSLATDAVAINSSTPGEYGAVTAGDLFTAVSEDSAVVSASGAASDSSTVLTTTDVVVTSGSGTECIVINFGSTVNSAPSADGTC
jgi:prepilin-type N-terminal cleavage/methylation domain-containing protein